MCAKKIDSVPMTALVKEIFEMVAHNRYAADDDGIAYYAGDVGSGFVCFLLIH